MKSKLRTHTVTVSNFDDRKGTFVLSKTKVRLTSNLPYHSVSPYVHKMQYKLENDGFPSARKYNHK